MSKRANNEGTVFQRQSDGRWVARLKLENGQKWQGTAKTQGLALDRLAAARTATRQGLPVQVSTTTVGEFLTTWLEQVARPRIKATTYVSYAELVRLHIAPHLGGYRLATLQPSHVQTFLNKRLASGLSPRRVQYLHAVLRSALEGALRWQLVARNVAKLVTPPRVPSVEIVPFTPDQAGAFLEAARGHAYGCLYTVLLGTGVRLGEALALRWSDVDPESGRVQVRHTLERLPGQPWRLTPPKSRTGCRVIPLIGPASAAIRAQRRAVLAARLQAGAAWHDHDLVFCDALGDPLSGSGVRHVFKRLLKVADLPTTYRVHDLRHSTATYLLAAGVPDRTVMQLLGHSTISMTMRYQHVMESMLADAATRLESVFPTASAAN